MKPLVLQSFDLRELIIMLSKSSIRICILISIFIVIITNTYAQDVVATEEVSTVKYEEAFAYIYNSLNPEAEIQQVVSGINYNFDLETGEEISQEAAYEMGIYPSAEKLKAGWDGINWDLNQFAFATEYAIFVCDLRLKGDPVTSSEYDGQENYVVYLYSDEDDGKGMIKVGCILEINENKYIWTPSILKGFEAITVNNFDLLSGEMLMQTQQWADGIGGPGGTGIDALPENTLMVAFPWTNGLGDDGITTDFIVGTDPYAMHKIGRLLGFKSVILIWNIPELVETSAGVFEDVGVYAYFLPRLED